MVGAHLTLNPLHHSVSVAQAALRCNSVALMERYDLRGMHPVELKFILTNLDNDMIENETRPILLYIFYD